MKKLDPLANLDLELWIKDILYENGVEIELDKSSRRVTMDMDDFLRLLEAIREANGEASKLRVVSRNVITKLEELAGDIDEFVK
ncbi:hypothetical protein DRO24_00075 [Candidatus Bathyarchaeota archaeon]|nr:MAG: hypothetical protein DRO24_00075 [Candidatus Bathyarchaeota archaeon]